MQPGRYPAVVAALGVTALAFAGCSTPKSHRSGLSMAAPPTIICGVVVTASPAGAVVYDISRSDFSHSQPVDAPTIGGVIIVQVARGCDAGSQVTITPPNAFVTTRVVNAADHLPVVLVLKPVRSVLALLVARQGSREVGRLKIDIPNSNL